MFKKQNPQATKYVVNNEVVNSDLVEILKDVEVDLKEQYEDEIKEKSDATQHYNIFVTQNEHQTKTAKAQIKRFTEQVAEGETSIAEGNAGIERATVCIATQEKTITDTTAALAQAKTEYEELSTELHQQSSAIESAIQLLSNVEKPSI